ncbi:MAG: nucleotide exchange factor GrpE, partial [Defluviitaleaceae bacterium]|nr:nucleotide exchange factor GrpE [Defluviitaleaceae bacterium]
VLMIQNQLAHMFEAIGMKSIPAVGETFDINLHSAVSHVKDDTKGEQEIVEELQKGYIYKDAVVRHAVVVVAN